MADDGDPPHSSMPLLGVVLCCTSVPQEKRAELASRVEQMGAVHKLDLTSDVTHLIVGQSDTPKYKYVAKERPDVKVLRPAWVDAVRALWMENEVIDLEALEAEYRMATFDGLKICLTGVEAARDRQQAIQKITENGGEHFGDLNKSVTHLIAMKPTGQKYKYAQVWGLKVVSMEWLDDSIERGMILEESLYSPHLAEEERGKGSWVRRTASGTSLGKRAREDSETIDAALGRRKLRRTASAKLTSQNNDIWKDIVGGGGFATTAPQVGQWEEERPQVAKSFDALDRPISGPSLSEMSNKENERPSKAPSASVHQAQLNKKHGLFRGKKIHLYGFDERKTSILRDHLLSNDAEIASSIVELSQSTPDTLASEGYIIVPHNSDRKQQPEPPPSQIPLHTVSEWWLERCLHRKTVVDPEVDAVSSPFQKYPIPGFDGMIICSTGFSGVDLLHVSKTARLLGASYEEYFSSSATILLCNGPSANIEKRRHAAEWKVPAVGIDWLWDCVRTGHKKAYSSYLVSAPAREPSPQDQSQTLETSTQFDRRMAQLSDGITNNVSRKPTISRATSISKVKSASTSKRNAPERDATTNEKPIAKGSDRSKSPSPLKPTNSIPAQEALTATSAIPSPPPEAIKQSKPPLQPAPSTTSLLTELAALRSHRTTSTTTSTSTAHAPKKAPPAPRRRRLLGRATSNTSAHSTPLSRGSTPDTEAHPLARRRTTAKAEHAPGPVTSQVAYDDPDARRHWERMGRLMSGKGAEGQEWLPAGEEKENEGIGVVRDVVKGNVSTRTRRRGLVS